MQFKDLKEGDKFRHILEPGIGKPELIWTKQRPIKTGPWKPQNAYFSSKGKYPTAPTKIHTDCVADDCEVELVK